ncbi:MAG: di-trans,poly-cis-decaprenylcistransferase [Gemmatimonadetes bacterium]|nr:di-trans,poly-cis-decaprenylcistransferase [Gemmatimonadota bacterium]NNM06309.1 di-trans,poly-cis-decaprenylcistransferase [Gemmatimonadota bacterium]
MTPDFLNQVRAGGNIPKHVAVIMDGNGRWARSRGLPRHAGHREGMKAVREALEGCIQVGIEVLTLFAFSTENWNRPPREISALMGLLELYAKKEKADLVKQGVEVHVLGELDRLSGRTRRAVNGIKEATAGGEKLRLNLMISYSGRKELVEAVRRIAKDVAGGELSPENIDDETLQGALFTRGLPDPDLLVRTSGEFRISNFMLWQLAYTEIHITPVLWPDFTRQDLFAAVLDYQQRDRRFGRVTTP